MNSNRGSKSLFACTSPDKHVGGTNSATGDACTVDMKSDYVHKLISFNLCLCSCFSGVQSNYTSSASNNVSPCYPVGGFQVLYDEAAENAAASNPSSDGGIGGVGAPYSSAGAGSSLDYLYANQRPSGSTGEKEEARG
jgi:hypothetical protein